MFALAKQLIFHFQITPVEIHVLLARLKKSIFFMDVSMLKK